MVTCMGDPNPSLGPCPACGHTSEHTCAPERLRAYARVEDTQSAGWYADLLAATQRLASITKHLRSYVTSSRTLPTSQVVSDLRDRVTTAHANGERYLTDIPASVSDLQRWFTELDELTARIDQLDDLLDAAQARYERFRWPRAFLVVTRGAGHVHTSMSCSTCYPTTQYCWMTEYSGANETDIVTDAGERACTICYPTAPVEVLARPTRMFSPDEVAADAERERKHADRARKHADRVAKAATKDGSELVVVVEQGIRPAWGRDAGRPYEYREHFKTERAALTWAVQASHPGVNGVRLNAITVIAESIADKRGIPVDEVLTEITARAAKHHR